MIMLEARMQQNILDSYANLLMKDITNTTIYNNFIILISFSHKKTDDKSLLLYDLWPNEHI